MEFSAVLRQRASLPKVAKIKYVSTNIVFLKLGFFQDAVVCSLSVERKKRLTVGVELAAIPDQLLCLDELTSELEGQSFSYRTYLQEAPTGWTGCHLHHSPTIIHFNSTIRHDPRAQSQRQYLLLRTCRRERRDVIRYFGKRGAYCPPGKNVAGFVIETAAKGTTSDGRPIDWDH